MMNCGYKNHTQTRDDKNYLYILIVIITFFSVWPKADWSCELFFVRYAGQCLTQIRRIQDGSI